MTAQFFRLLTGGLALLFAGMVQPAAIAQTGGQQCCNTRTGEWSTDSAAVCEARPGHVFVTAANTPAAMACFQRTVEEARQSALEALRAVGIDPATVPTLGENPGMPDIPGGIPGLPDGIPGMPGGGSGMTPVSAAAEPECCNVRSGQWAGAMASAACLARANHVPDTPDYLEQTQICRPGQGGGGGAWSVEEYEPNIENGGMEDWRDEHRPVGFATFAPAPEIARNAMPDFQVAFRDPDAHTGQYSLRLRNFDFMTQLPPETAAIVRGVVGESGIVAPAGAFTCSQADCPSETGTPVANNTLSGAMDVFGSLASDDVMSHVCGAYKGYIAISDQLDLRVQVFDGGSTVAGSAVRTFTDSASDWVEFAMPMTSVGQPLPASGRVGIAAQITARGSNGTAMMSHNVSPLTDVRIDSIHFCDPMGLTAFHPAVIAGGTGMAVPESEEDTLGVQTFVNLDNDDRDGQFDLADTSGVAGDNELVRIRMELPLNSFGTVEFQAANVGTGIQLWDDANKTRPFELYNQEVEVEVLLPADAQGSRRIRDVWIEALAPSTAPGDNVFEFFFRNRLNNDEETVDRIVLTALGIESIVWEGQGNSINDDDTLDPDPNWPGAVGNGVRVFPGRRWAGDQPETEARDKVTVQVTLNVEPPRPVTFFFRAFDVDDPTEHDNEVDDETEAEDNRGTSPNRWGGFPGTNGEIRELELTDRTGEFDFQVTMQPGDNFRIVGNGDRSFLEQLENDDRILADLGPVHATKIVDRHILESTGRVSEARIRQHENYATETLTVWRKLYIEIDTMGPVADNSVEATIIDHRPDAGMTAPGGAALLQFWLRLNVNLYESLPETSRTGIAGYVNNYAPGWLTLAGTDYQINAHTTNDTEMDEVRVAYPSAWGPFTDADHGSIVSLRDDDVLRNGDALPPIPMQRVAPAFAPAYVLPIYEGGPDAGAPPNPNREQPFLLHFGSDDPADLRPVFRAGFDNAGHHEQPDIWVIYLLNAFQGQLKEDGDGDPGIAGHADGVDNYGVNGMGAVIYQESGRENALSYAAHNTAANVAPEVAGFGWRLEDATAHEIGHLFSGAHTDGGLMGEDAIKSIDFTPVTLDRIRSARNP